MSCTISKELPFEEVSLEVLRGKTLAIDVMPILYKYLYTTRKEHVLQTTGGAITSYIRGFLYFLKNLKKAQITPIICLDKFHPSIKKETVAKRMEIRKKGLDKFNFLLENQIELTQEEKKSFNNYNLYIGENEKDKILQLLSFLDTTSYMMEYVEAEKAAVELKKIGFAEAVYSLDRDLILYNTSFYTNIDFKKKTVRFYNYPQILDHFNVNPDQMTLATLICGTDYSSGVPMIGPKTVFKFLKSPDFMEKVRHFIPHLNTVINYLKDPIVLEYPYLRKGTKNPTALVSMLKDLEFSEKFILSIGSYLI